jgi:hypothetical protein
LKSRGLSPNFFSESCGNKFDSGDRITLTGNLSFSNLNISQNGNDTFISAGTDLLAILKYTQSNTITSAILA